MSNFVHASYADDQAAQLAVRNLLDESFRPRMIRVTTREHGIEQRVPVTHHTGVLPGIAVGAILGAICGIMSTMVFGLTTAGPLLAFIQGLVGGGAAGALAGALAGLAFWSDDADFPPSATAGPYDVGVVTIDARVDNATQALRRAEPIAPPEVTSTRATLTDQTA